MASDPPSSGNKELEQALRDFHPAPLDRDFLSRLEAAAEGDLTILDPSEIHFESSLRRHSPSALHTDFLARLQSTVAGVPFALDEKIVLFPKTAPAKAAARKSRTGWAAAAAVALIGGVTALMIPARGPGAPVAGKAPVTESIPSAPSNFQPAGFNSTADTEDVGVSWHQAEQPHRVLRLTYRDRMTLRNADGKTIEVEQPRVEYIFVPEKMD